MYVHNDYMQLFKGLKTDDFSVYVTGMVDRMPYVDESQQAQLVPKKEQAQVLLTWLWLNQQ